MHRISRVPRSNRRPIAIAALLLACLHPAPAQDATPVFQATTNLVLVDVQVLHAKTRAPGPVLTVRDLRILEDGVPQDIRFFSRDELPLSVVLLFDGTPSVHGPLKRLAEAARGALDHFKPQDEVAVVTYGASARVVDGFSTDRERNARAIADAAGKPNEENAYFNEAVYQAAMQLRRSSNPGARRVIVWLTDNEPNVPDRARPLHSEIDTLHALNEDGVVVAPILLRDAAWLPFIAMYRLAEYGAAKARPPGDAARYAELTGGNTLKLAGKSPAERLGALIDELRARYTIGFSPSADKPAGTFCDLRVELAPETALRPKEWTVFARRGYYRK
jgi:VWFA-related protein